MDNVIYLDVLLAVNMIVNFLLMWITSTLSASRTSTLRLIFASIIGSMLSLIILLPSQNILILGAIRFVGASLMVIIGFGKSTIKTFIRQVLYLFGTSFIFAGLMFAIWIFITPSNMTVSNSVVYFNISALTLIISSTIIYAIIRISLFFMKRKVPTNNEYEIIIEYNSNFATTYGILDTGNSLYDMFSGLPVLITEYKVIEGLFSKHQSEIFKTSNTDDFLKHLDSPFKHRFRLIPYNAVGINSVLPAFLPDKVTLTSGNKSIKTKDTYIAVTRDKLSDGQFSALINPDIVNV